MMKSLMVGLAAAALLAGCDQMSGDADLRADVDDLNAEVFGRKCKSGEIITDITAYEKSIEGLPEADLDPEVWHTSNGARGNVTTTESGLQYTVVQKGDPDKPKPVGSQSIKVNYHGFFPNGDVFDSSYNRGEPIEFPANGVIKGWIEGLGGMSPCEARTLYIPGDLAYGPEGRASIPPNATLIFYVQLLAVGE